MADKANLIKEVEVISRYEGFTIQEAKLSYKSRENLPTGAFCGPDRTYPAHDAAHVRNGFAKLATFGHRLPQEVRGKIVRCLIRKASRFGVEHDQDSYKWKADGSANTKVKETAPSKIAWYLKELGVE